MDYKGANAVVGQSGGPTAAINATLAGVISGCMKSGKVEKLYGMKNGIEGFEKEDFISLYEYFEDDGENKLSLLSATPAAALGSCRKRVKDDEQATRIFEILKKYNIRYFFYIGGNDSMDTVSYLSDYAQRNPGVFDVKFIGVPKTIDNDLCMTDHTPGFGSAAKYVATMIQEIVRDCSVYKVKAVTVVEIMGRDAGWLTASAAIPAFLGNKGADYVYVPENAFDEDAFIESLKKDLENPDKPYIVVAVSEGIKNADGEYAGEKAMKGAVDAFGHKYLSGTGKYLENLIKEKIGCKCRSVELNLPQRCASHIASECDIREAFEIGSEAVSCALSGLTGVMMAFERIEGDEYSCRIVSRKVSEIANQVKSIPCEFLSDGKVGVNDKCVEYILPLIKGENKTEYRNGLPVHFEF